ncbi:LuxR family two component transcriptional regulator [Neolewinella xylanilytica]|uniref:LuxR family two component transcriptional regulator n=1 Tax=Neolewinella xylanilytica TaxID=1514080 RepID=A0A2S6IA66_9BACT|nr:response regulator transcription factor [Neolewinella xylanilytica]PPK88391.1 LuxR family two component transcriptional regulator [Neolewinella xylanilytica]
MPTQILLADDHALVRDGIRRLLEDEPDLQVVAEADDGVGMLEMVERVKPDLAIVDIRMPRLNGIEAVRQLRDKGDKTPCLMLSMHDSEEYVLQSIDAGAFGYLLKDASREEFLRAVHTIVGGDRYFSGDLSNILIRQLMKSDRGVSSASPAREEVVLTRRERQILPLILEGATNQEIADRLDVSRRTVETHRFNMMKKLGVSNSSELNRRVRELGLL